MTTRQAYHSRVSTWRAAGFSPRGQRSINVFPNSPTLLYHVQTCTRNKQAQRGRSHRSQSGFSLVEIMIAIAILGFGLVMIATMFPIAWQRARTMAEFTSQTAATESAHTTLKLLLKVSSTTNDVASFAGDIVVVADPLDPNINIVLAYPDVRVHLLHMENLLVNPRGFYPPRDNPSAATSPPYLLEQEDPLPPSFSSLYVYPAFGAPQVRLEQRMYPPLPPRDNVDPSTGEFVSDDPNWDATFASRRFAWVAFHRLLSPQHDTGDTATTCMDPANQDGCPAFLSQTREFDMYYATVKRSRVRIRYAQQDPGPAPLPSDPSPVTPVALDETEDVMLPTPWRVQIYVPNDSTNPLAATDDDRVGVPTIVEVNTINAPSASFVVDFFQRGTKFIDEFNGEIYEVINRRVKTGSTPDDVEAFLTLDQEIVSTDIFDSPGAEQPVRTVWVFPPPVEAERLSDGTPIFDGSPPVIGIDKRTLSVSPIN